jgi:hypothetical protein
LEQTISAITALQASAPEGCPYVFMEAGRWDFYRRQVDSRSWRPGQHVLNNVLRRFKTRCRKAAIGEYTIHDLRRSCITNWAAHLPIHVVQRLAGHSDIKTTQTYYLFIREEDIAKARDVQSDLLGKMSESCASAKLLPNSTPKRCFPGMRGCQVKKKALDQQGLARLRATGVEPVTFGSVERTWPYNPFPHNWLHPGNYAHLRTYSGRLSGRQVAGKSEHSAD